MPLWFGFLPTPLFPVRKRNLSLVSCLTPPPRLLASRHAVVRLSRFPFLSPRRLHSTHQILPLETSTSESTESSHHRQQLLPCSALLCDITTHRPLQSPLPPPSTPIRPRPRPIPPHSGGAVGRPEPAAAPGDRPRGPRLRAPGSGGGVERHCWTRRQSSGRRRRLAGWQGLEEESSGIAGFGGNSSSWRRCLTDS